MWVWLDRISLILFDATVSTALFLSLVMLAILFCRQPSRRLRIARVALVSSLMMMPLVALAPLPRLDITDAIIRSDLFPALLVFNPDQKQGTPQPTTSHDHAGRWTIAGALSARIPQYGKWLERGITLIGLAGIGIGLGWLILGFWGVRWLIRHARQPSARTQTIFDQLYADPGTRHRRAVLRVSGRVKRPVVVGMLGPTILIPQTFEDLEDGELLRLTLLHELAHAEQSDPWFGTAASLAQSVWFFLPQIWWLRSQLLIDQEFLADRFAARGYGTSSGYAAALLALAESGSPNTEEVARACESEPGWPAGQNKAIQSPLFQRVLMLLHCPFQFEAHPPRSWSWTLRLMVIGASVMAACLCLRWPNAVALEVLQKGKSLSTLQSFRVASLVAKPVVFSKDGRSLAYTFPVVLPSHFNLTVEVLAYPADLAQVRIANHPLRSPPPLISTGDHNGTINGNLESWHQVRLVRGGDALSLWVDGQSIRVDTRSDRSGDWLTVEPGTARSVALRNLVVTW